MSEPQWLSWSRQLQSIAQAGLTFARDPYDIERYEAMRALAAEILGAHTATAGGIIESLLREEKGYPTPKIDVRGAVFDSAGRILMVREAIDGDRWTLPGGWAEVNLSVADSVVKEVREESGYEARVVRPVAMWDRARQGHPPTLHACLKLFFLCQVTGGGPATSLETSGTGWFAREAIPADLSLGRVLPRQIDRMFDHFADPHLPLDYE